LSFNFVACIVAFKRLSPRSAANGRNNAPTFHTRFVIEKARSPVSLRWDVKMTA